MDDATGIETQETRQPGRDPWYARRPAPSRWVEWPFVAFLVFTPLAYAVPLLFLVPEPNLERLPYAVVLAASAVLVVPPYFAGLGLAFYAFRRGMPVDPTVRRGSKWIAAVGLVSLVAMVATPNATRTRLALRLRLATTPLPADATWVQLYDGGPLHGTGYFVRPEPTDDSSRVRLAFRSYSVEATGDQWRDTDRYHPVYAWRVTEHWWYVYHNL